MVGVQGLIRGRNLMVHLKPAPVQGAEVYRSGQWSDVLSKPFVGSLDGPRHVHLGACDHHMHNTPGFTLFSSYPAAWGL
jgi:hypothetical protein